MTIYDVTLVIVIIVVLVALAVLIYDLVLYLRGRETITEKVWRGRSGWGLLLVAWFLVGACALAVHFFW